MNTEKIKTVFEIEWEGSENVKCVYSFDFNKNEVRNNNQTLNLNKNVQ